MSDFSSSKTTKKKKDWTRGSIPKNLLHLSWPIVVSDALNTIGPTIDLIVLGFLGAVSISSQAGVGVAGSIYTIAIVSGIGINMGVRAMISRYTGGKEDRSQINNVIKQALVINTCYGFGAAFVGIVFAKPILMMFGLEEGVLALGVSYMRIAFLNAIPMSYHMMGESFMQA